MIGPTFGLNQTFTPDGLIGGDFDIVGKGVTIASGAGVLARGAVLGKVTASGKYILSLSAASDGSQVPSAVLAENVDASSADVAATVFLSGMFVESALILGTGQTLDGIRDTLRDANIYLKKSRG